MHRVSVGAAPPFTPPHPRVPHAAPHPIRAALQQFSFSFSPPTHNLDAHSLHAVLRSPAPAFASTTTPLHSFARYRHH